VNSRNASSGLASTSWPAIFSTNEMRKHPYDWPRGDGRGEGHLARTLEPTDPAYATPGSPMPRTCQRDWLHAQIEDVEAKKRAEESQRRDFSDCAKEKAWQLLAPVSARLDDESSSTGYSTNDEGHSRPAKPITAYRANAALHGSPPPSPVIAVALSYRAGYRGQIDTEHALHMVRGWGETHSLISEYAFGVERPADTHAPETLHICVKFDKRVELAELTDGEHFNLTGRDGRLLQPQCIEKEGRWPSDNEERTRYDSRGKLRSVMVWKVTVVRRGRPALARAQSFLSRRSASFARTRSLPRIAMCCSERPLPSSAPGAPLASTSTPLRGRTISFPRLSPSRSMPTP